MTDKISTPVFVCKQIVRDTVDYFAWKAAIFTTLQRDRALAFKDKTPQEQLSEARRHEAEDQEEAKRRVVTMMVTNDINDAARSSNSTLFDAKK